MSEKTDGHEREHEPSYEQLEQTLQELEEARAEAGRRISEIQDQRRAIMNILTDVEDSRNQLRTINIALASEIEDRRKAEEQVRAALTEKETLLKEIHHRVKNNLQIISSLLHLQSKKITDENVLAVFRDSENRVKSMSIIHENLYKSADLARVDFGSYIKSLTGILYESYGISAERIRLNIDVNNALFEIDTAVPLALIINELVSNAMKYAFPGERKGNINVSLEKAHGNSYKLTVSDNGAGLPDGFDMNESASLGMRLVHNLVHNQLRGTIEIAGQAGATFAITFGEIPYKRRI